MLRVEVAAEAIQLVRVLRELLPDRAELDALLALKLIQHSRRDARVGDGEVILLPDQDRSRWHQGEIAEALELLTPLTRAPAASYLLEALIAAEHAIPATAETTYRSRIAVRYRELEERTGSAVVRLNRAAAVAEADGPPAGQRLLDGLDLPGQSASGRPGRALATQRSRHRGDRTLRGAIVACDNDPERRHLQRRIAGLRGGTGGQQVSTR